VEADLTHLDDNDRPKMVDVGAKEPSSRVAMASGTIKMSQEAYEKHEPGLSPDGILLYEEELVESKPARDSIRMYGIPATRFAEELGNPMVLNMIMLGFLSGTSGMIEPKAARNAIAASVPGHFVELNHLAFNKGYQYGKGIVAGEKVAGGMSS